MNDPGSICGEYGEEEIRKGRALAALLSYVMTLNYFLVKMREIGKSPL
jgi:hypothetical protein